MHTIGILTVLILLSDIHIPILTFATHYSASTLYDFGLYGAYPCQSFVTVDFEAPKVNIKHWSDRCYDGKLILLTPRGRSVPTVGPMILDNQGNMIWSGGKQFGLVSDLRVQHYNGAHYLTFWAGRDDGTHGFGVYYMLDASYDVVRFIQPVGDVLGDLHEFVITPSATALLTIYSDPEAANLSAWGITETGYIIDSVFQEIDLHTGELILEWRARNHYDIAETFAPIGNFGQTKDTAFDYFHINSIDKDDHGNYYISSRYMHTITCISPAGQILWRLGGVSNDFEDLSYGAATNFTWQHHMRWYPGDRITLFDNGAFNWKSTAEYSRGLYIQLDTTRMTAELIQSFVKPGILAHSQGSVQLLENTHNVFVGWGHSAAYTEFAANGDILCDVHYGASLIFDFGWVKSYRAVKASWIGRPRHPPSLAMDKYRDVIYVSWNGATDVVDWEVDVGFLNDNGSMEFNKLRRVRKEGFETKINLITNVQASKPPLASRMPFPKSTTRSTSIPVYRVLALDGFGNVLGISGVLNGRTGQAHAVPNGDGFASDPVGPARYQDSSTSLSVFVFYISAVATCGACYHYFAKLRKRRLMR